MVCLGQTMHLSCTYIAPTITLSPNGPKLDSTWPTSPRTSILCVQNIFCVYGPFGANSTPILRQDQHYLQMRWNELPLEPRHLGVPSGVSKTIFEPMVRSAQTMHLYCTDTNTISKNEIAHDPLTYEFHCVCPRWFPSLMVAWHKLHTLSRLALSSNGKNELPLKPFHLGVL
jgi:hypothetical protein